MLDTGNLINDQKYKDLSKQMMVINSRLKAIQDALINSHSNLSECISRIIFDLNDVLVDEFTKYQTDMQKHPSSLAVLRENWR